MTPGCPKLSGDLAVHHERTKGKESRRSMVANMIRLLRARMALPAVDEAGMSTAEYSNV